MRSFLLQQLTRLLLPLAILLGLSFVLEGHDRPGGGFDGGLALAAAAILAFAAYGAQRFHSAIPLQPERIATLGGLVLMLTLVLPQLLGKPALTQLSGTLRLGPFAWHWQAMVLFEVGVVMTVAGSFAAAALWLWETPTRTERGN